MATTNLNIRIDTNLKKEAELVFSELGMTMSTALNIFLKRAVNYGGIPFDLRVETPNAETLAAIQDSNNNRGISEEFSDVEALIRDLNA